MDQLKEKLAILPELPGCYLMKNQVNTIIYIGKAKNLKNRVRSYFTGAHEGKVQKMIEEIHQFEYIVTKNEAEALILESQLIKANQPRYNILLKDDKSYPFLAITSETHPRLILTRQPQKKYRALFGPYISAYDARAILDVLNYLYPLRKCVKLPKKLCLYYHIHQCLGPCVYPIHENDYIDYIKDIQDFLKGKTQKVKKVLQEKMQDAANQLAFEQAKLYRDMLQSMEQLMNKKAMYHNIKLSTDVIGFAMNDDFVAIQIFHIREGSVVERESEMFVNENGDVNDLIESFLYQFYQSKRNIVPQVIIKSEKLELSSFTTLMSSIDIQIPKQGVKKQLVQFAMKNAHEALEQKALLTRRAHEKTIGAIEMLGKQLAIPTPYHIEMIDTANLRNQDIVSGLIVFKNGLPDKKNYRKFIIKSTDVQDDYQALREVVYRRVYRLLMENKKLPDLLIVDGGIGHVHVAQEVLQSLHAPVPVIGLSKNQKHKTEAMVQVTGEKIILRARDSLTLFLSYMQEEVHRFVIDYHRKKRMQSTLSSELLKIPGIGEIRRKELLAYYLHVNEIKKASVDSLRKILPQQLAENVYHYFQQTKEQESEESK